MAKSLDRVLAQGPGVWTSLGRTQQMLILALGLVLPVMIFVGSQWLNEGQYVPLFASLTTEDAGAITTQLKAAKVPYRLGGNGEQILVPADKANEMRLRMAVQGLPLGGGVGFEVFDKPALGVSDFAQRMNYQRALQGELARTIGQLRAVVRARVHLVLPQPSLFTDRDRPASASVFLKLAPGVQLGREEVRGIVHLVASSVEGLTAERVTIVDTAGRVLSAGSDAAGTAPVSGRRMEIKAAVEDGMEKRLQSLLDSVLGQNQAVARVSAQLNFDQVERTEEKYDPNAIPRQRTKTQETTKATSTTPAPGAAATTSSTTASVTGDPPPAPSVAATSNDANRQSETVTYEISRIVARTLTTPGEVARMTVAVLLNTPTKTVVGDDKKETRQPAPRSAEELEKIRKVVMGAIGFTAARGDEVTVVEIPFDTTIADRERVMLDGPAAPAPTAASRPSAIPMPMVVGGAVLAVIVVALIVWIVVRGRSRTRTLAEVTASLSRQEEGAAHEAGTLTPATKASAPRPPTPLVPEEMLALSREREDIREKAYAMATAEPDAAAQLIRAWLVKKKPRAKGVAVGAHDAS